MYGLYKAILLGHPAALNARRLGYWEDINEDTNNNT